MIALALMGLATGCFTDPDPTAAGEGRGGQDRPPDVFIVTVDTLRRDHVGAYNPDSPAETPAMDALAADSLRFNDAFSPISVTGPAFTSAFTGLYPDKHGVLLNLFRNGTSLDEQHTTLAELMKASGYSTGAFVSAFTLRPALGLNQGFDVYNSGGQKNRKGGQTAAVFSKWLRVQEGPVFAWYHSFDPHGPVSRHLQEGDLTATLEREPGLMDHFPQYQRIEDITDPTLYETLYARGVSFADKQVAKVLTAIRASGRYDDAIIVFFSDHGEGFRERSLWYDHGAFSHVEQTLVPLMVKLPGGERAGEIDDRLASLVDVTPTVVELASIEGLPPVDGRSLMHPSGGHTTVLSESSHCKRIAVLDCMPAGGEGKVLAVRDAHTTLVSEPRTAGEVLMSYDRTQDPKEWSGVQVEAAGALKDVLDAMRSDRRGRSYGALPALGARDVDAETQQLRALGYVE